MKHGSAAQPTLLRIGVALREEPDALPMQRRVMPRWLVAACAAVFFSTAAFAAAPIDENQVIVPKAAVEKSAADNRPAAGNGVLTFFGVLVLGGVGGWMVWRGRKGGVAQLNRTARHLVVEETRSLGNRQYLVVAAYQDKKFLLGVCQGRIDLLSPLNGEAAPAVPEKTRS